MYSDLFFSERREEDGSVVFIGRNTVQLWKKLKNFSFGFERHPTRKYVYAFPFSLIQELKDIILLSSHFFFWKSFKAKN